MFYFLSFSQGEETFFKVDKNKGLSNDRINSINQDHNQFIWIATMNGLSRYDGLKVKNYNRQNSNILSNIIFDICIDSKARMWLATTKGLCLYNTAKDNFESFVNESDNSKNTALNNIHCILEDKKGQLWLGTKDGVYIFNPMTKMFSECMIERLQNNNNEYKNITSLTQNSKGVIYAGSFGGGLLKFNSGTTSFKAIASKKNTLNYIFDLHFLNDHEILIGASGNGAILYNTEDNNFQDFFKKIGNQNITASIIRNISIDADNNIWLGTDGDGLYQVKNRTDKPEILHFKNAPQRSSSLSGNAIYSIFQDHSKNYWIGTAWNGVNYLSSQKKFDFLFSDILGEKNAAVLSIYKHKDILYFGLDGDGLMAYNTITQKITNYNPKTNTKFKGASIQCIHQNGNSLWLGTFADGLIHVDLVTKKHKQYTHNIVGGNSISYNDIRSIQQDHKGNLWLATDGGGLNYFDVGREYFTVYKSDENDPTTISTNNLTALQLVGHNLWVGTSDGGVDLFDTITKKVTHYQYDDNNENSISSNSILSLLKDSKGNLWIGTADEGVNRVDFQKNLVQRFLDKKKIEHQKITGIIEDNNGVIWFSSKGGVFNYDYVTDKFQNFPNLDKKYHRNSIYKEANGDIYFGSDDGVVKINPATFEYKKEASKTIIKDLKLFNKAVPIDGKVLSRQIIEEERIFLEHNQDVITFEFATLNYPSSENFEYNIQMENFDKDWRNIGTDNKITYTNLSSGDYIFKLKSRRIGLDWPEEFTSIAIKINKPIWLKWWAICFYIILIGFVFYLFRTYIISWEKMKSNLALERLAHEKDKDLAKVKLEFFTNISHEIRTPLTLILSSINSLLTTEHFVGKNQLNTIQKNSSHLLGLMNNLLDYRKLENKSTSLKVSNNNWVEFCSEILLSFKEFATQKKIELKFQSSTSNIPLWFDKNQMKKVVFNLLSNAIKFTGDNKLIKLKIKEEEDYVIMIVEDQGVGIPQKHLSHIFNRFYQTDIINNKKNYTGFGLGLSISKEIVDLHQGSIDVRSILNKGTKFVITLKKGKAHFVNQSVSFVENEENDVVNNIPIQEEEEEDLKSNELEENLSSNKEVSVLIVEDNNDLREYIVSVVSKFYQTIEAVDGKQGWKITKKQLPDLIISDVMMPVMDGVEMTSKIKANVNTSHIPVILLTAKDSLVYELEGYSIGAEDYIIKPFNESLLIGKIKSIIRNRQLLHKRMSNDEKIIPEELPINERDQKILEKLIALIETNIASENLNSKFITSELGVSHSVIYKKIKALTGLSLIEFITEIRLKTARKFLLEKDYSVTDVCYKVGYSNRKYFSKIFKKRFDKNPSDYKKNRKEANDKIEDE